MLATAAGQTDPKSEQTREHKRSEHPFSETPSCKRRKPLEAACALLRTPAAPRRAESRYPRTIGDLNGAGETTALLPPFVKKNKPRPLPPFVRSCNTADTPNSVENGSVRGLLSLTPS